MTMDGSASSPVLDELIGSPPEITLRSGSVNGAAASVVAVVLAAGEDGSVFDATARRAGSDLGVELDRLVESESLRGDAGSVLAVPLTGADRLVTRLLVVGVGVGAGEPRDWRTAGAAVARRAGTSARFAVIAQPAPAGLRAFAEGVALGSYRVSGLLERVGQPGPAPRMAGPGPTPGTRPAPTRTRAAGRRHPPAGRCARSSWSPTSRRIPRRSPRWGRPEPWHSGCTSPVIW